MKQISANLTSPPREHMRSGEKSEMSDKTDERTIKIMIRNQGAPKPSASAPQTKSNFPVVETIAGLGGLTVAGLGVNNYLNGQETLQKVSEQAAHTTDWGDISKKAALGALGLASIIGFFTWLNGDSQAIRKLKIEKGVI